MSVLSRHLRPSPNSRLSCLSRSSLRLLLLLGDLRVCLQRAVVPRHGRPASERAQSTVEYALILLGAAAVALVVVAWVTRSDAIGRLFDTVLGRILSQAA